MLDPARMSDREGLMPRPDQDFRGLDSMPLLQG